MSNDERITKHPSSLGYGVAGECRISAIIIVRHWSIRHCFELRHSDFVIPSKHTAHSRAHALTRARARAHDRTPG